MPPPGSPWFVLLLVLLVPARAGSLAFFRRQFPAAPRLWLVAPGVLVASLLLFIHTVGLLTGSFHAGLVTALVAGGAWGAFHWSRETRSTIRSGTIIHLDGAGWAVAVGLMLIVPSIIWFDYHDKVRFISGHFSIPSQMENGGYPPRSMNFPAQPWIYHYLVDTLFASVATLLRLRVDLAIKLTTTLAWGYSLLLVVAVARGLGLRRRTWLAPLVFAFGGGLPWLFLWRWPHTGEEFFGEMAIYRGYNASHPIVSNFFQHAYTLGTPVFLCLVLVLLHLWDPRHPERRWPAVTAWIPAVLVGTLALGQVTFFVVTLLAMAMVQGHAAVVSRERGAWRGLVWLVLLPGVFALFAGGMLGSLVVRKAVDVFSAQGWMANVDGPLPSALRFESDWGWPLTRDKLKWMVASVGFLWLGAGAFFRRQKPVHQFLGWAALWCLTFPFFFYYQHSWDIVKFLQCFQIILAIPMALLLRRLFSRATAPAFRVLGGLLLVVTLVPGAFYQLPFWTGMKHNKPDAIWRAGTMWSLLTDDEKAAMDWLRIHSSSSEIVLCDEKLARQCAMFAGLPQLYMDRFAETYIVPGLDQRMARRQRLLSYLPSANAQALVQEGVCWALFRDGDASLLKLEITLKDGGLQPAMSTPTTRVYALCVE